MTTNPDHSAARRILTRLSDRKKPPSSWWNPLRESLTLDEADLSSAVDMHKSCSETVRRTMLSLLAVALFCTATVLGSEDSLLLGKQGAVIIPFANTKISFASFLIVAPLILIALSIYLHIFVGLLEHLDAQLKAAARGRHGKLPTLFNIDRPVARALSAFIFYFTVPLTLAVITWKSAVRPEWLLPIGGLTLSTAFIHLFLQIRRSPERGGRLWRYMAPLRWLVLTGVLVLAFRVGMAPEQYIRPLNLYRANLADTDLRQSKFLQATLVPANLKGADLRSSNLEAADLRGADLRGANLARANLRLAKICGADLRGADLNDADLRGADFFQQRTCDDEEGIDRVYADLRGARLSGARLEGANLTLAKLQGADFINARLHAASFHEADFSGATLSDPRAAAADFSYAVFKGAYLKGSEDATLSGSDFESAHLQGADLRGAYLSGATFDNADLVLTDLRSASFEPDNFWNDLKVETLEGLTENYVNRDLKNIISTRFDEAEQNEADAEDANKKCHLGEFNSQKHKGVNYDPDEQIFCGAPKPPIKDLYYNTLIAYFSDIGLCKDPYVTLGLLRRTKSTLELQGPFPQWLKKRSANGEKCNLPNTADFAASPRKEIEELAKKFSINLN